MPKSPVADMSGADGKPGAGSVPASPSVRDSHPEEKKALMDIEA